VRRIVVQGTIIVLIVGPMQWTVKHTFLLYKGVFLRYRVSHIAYIALYGSWKQAPRNRHEHSLYRKCTSFHASSADMNNRQTGGTNDGW
jgi:hypothetical protein